MLDLAKALDFFHYLRMVGGTGFAFILFGMGGLFLNGIILLIGWFPFPSQKIKEGVVQKVLYYAFRGFMFYLQGFNLIHSKAIGMEKLPKSGGYILVANHPTLLDVVLILAHLPRAYCIVKPEILNSIYMSGVSRLAGYIANTDGEKLIEKCIEKLKQGFPLVIFPEGTRSLPNEIGKFKRSAAWIALKSGFPIVTSVVRCSELILMKQWRWFDLPPHSIELSFTIYDTINPNDFSVSKAGDAIHARRLTAYLKRFYEGTLNYASYPRT